METAHIINLIVINDGRKKEERRMSGQLSRCSPKCANFQVLGVVKGRDCPVNVILWNEEQRNCRRVQTQAEIIGTFIYCPNEWTLDPAVCSQTNPPMPQPAALGLCSSSRNVLWQRLTIFSSEYYQTLIATHLPTREG